MNNYHVTWGEDTATVYAENGNDAWAKFAEGRKLTTAHPKAFERTIEPVPDAPPEPDKPKKTKEK